MNTKPYDQAFKFIAEQDPESLLVLLGAITPDEHPLIELLPREISAAAVLPDQPYRVISSRGERIVHLEAWTYWEKAIPHRMVEYGPLHWLKYRLPVESYVLLLTPHGCPSRPPSFICRPITAPFGAMARARRSLTIATPSPPARSRSSKARPRSSVAPSAWK